jgi:hypothetical protein
MTEGLSAWAERSGRRSLCVISPHLDDAVYSAYSALTLPWFHRKVVATLVTDAPQGKKTYWATYTGFADAHVEHVERSMEDERVLAAMGVEACHLGGESENEVSIAVAVQRFSERFLANPERWVFLVPAAAGRTFGVMDAHPPGSLAKQDTSGCCATASGSSAGEGPYCVPPGCHAGLCVGLLCGKSVPDRRPHGRITEACRGVCSPTVVSG